MKTIRYTKKEYVDIGFGFTGIITTETTLDGLVMKAYAFKGLREDEAVHLTSVLSKEYDSTYLYSLVFRVLANRKLLEQMWAKSLKHAENIPE